MRLILALILSIFIIGCNFQQLPYLESILVDDFTIPGEISAQGTSGASVQTNLGDSLQILGTQRVLFSYLQGQSVGTNQDFTSFMVNPPNATGNFGTILFNTASVKTGFGIILWDGVNGDAGNPCGLANEHLSDPRCANGCPTLYTGLQLDITNKDGFAFLLNNVQPVGGATFLLSLWTTGGGYAYSRYVYPGAVNPGQAQPEIFFAFDALTIINPVNFANVMAIALEINTTNTQVNVSIGHPQIMGSTLVKASTLNPNINPGSSEGTVGPGSNVTFHVLVLPDIFELTSANQNVVPISYTATVTDTLPAGFNAFSASNPFPTAAVHTLTESLESTNLTTLVSNVLNTPSTPITPVTSTNGLTASATFNFTNPQGVRLTYTATTANSFNFCQQQVCNQANVELTTYGVNGNAVASESTTYCVTLQGSPLLTTQITSCPSSYNAFPQTTVSVCNNGSGQATSISFSQSIFNKCSVTSVSNGAITCSGGTCSGNLGNLNPTQCTNVHISFNCSSSQTSNVPITFSSQASASETCVGSSSTSQLCTFSFNPGTPVLVATYTTCPSTFSANPSTVGKICNTGNANAISVFFNQTVFPGCNPTSTNNSNVICSGGFCTGVLGDLAPNACQSVSVNFNCASYITTCNVKQLSTSFSTSETFIGATASSGSCNLVTNPSLTVSVSETLVNSTPAKVGDTITWNIVALNNGPATAQTWSLSIVVPQFTSLTTATQTLWNCSGNTCVFTGPSSLAATASSAPVPFSVSVLNSIPLSASQVFNNVTLTTGPSVPNCVATAMTSGSAPVSVGTPDISVSKAAVATQYTFTIDYSSVGTGPVNSLTLYEALQTGWTLASTTPPQQWLCGDTTCLYDLGNVPNGQSGTVLFIVNVDPSVQTAGKCWNNLVTSTFNDEIYDPTIANNEASATIGSSCSSCCAVPACPQNICNVTCPDPNITVTAPCPQVQCTCDIPEYWCPPCQVEPAACTCGSCSNATSVIVGTNQSGKKK